MIKNTIKELKPGDKLELVGRQTSNLHVLPLGYKIIVNRIYQHTESQGFEFDAVGSDTRYFSWAWKKLPRKRRIEVKLP